jgi:hypothetical protein
MSSINTPTPTIAKKKNIAEPSKMAKNAPNAIVNTLVPSASINAKRKASSEIEVAQAPVKKAKNKEGLKKSLQGRLDVVYNSMLSILQNDPMGYQYEDFDESGFILLSTTCGVVDYDHYIGCDLDGGEVAECYPEWEELYKEYHKITLEAEQPNINLVFGK